MTNYNKKVELSEEAKLMLARYHNSIRTAPPVETIIKVLNLKITKQSIHARAEKLRRVSRDYELGTKELKDL